MTDVWTSGGVLIGIVAVVLMGWQRLDPLIALCVALNIVWSGVKIIRSSVRGLMDGALLADEQRAMDGVLQKVGPPVQFHAVRTRQAGTRRSISLHVLVPGDWSVRRGHDLIEDL